MKYIFKNTCLDLYHDPFNLFVIFISRACHWIVQMDRFVYYSDKMSQKLLTEMNIAIMSMFLLEIYEWNTCIERII